MDSGVKHLYVLISIIKTNYKNNIRLLYNFIRSTMCDLVFFYFIIFILWYCIVHMCDCYVLNLHMMRDMQHWPLS